MSLKHATFILDNIFLIEVVAWLPSDWGSMSCISWRRTQSQTPQECAACARDCALVSLVKSGATVKALYLCRPLAFHMKSNPGRCIISTGRESDTRGESVSRVLWCRRFHNFFSLFRSHYIPLSKLIWQWYMEVFCMWRHEAKCQTCFCKLVVNDGFPSFLARQQFKL